MAPSERMETVITFDCNPSFQPNDYVIHIPKAKELANRPSLPAALAKGYETPIEAAGLALQDETWIAPSLFGGMFKRNPFVDAVVNCYNAHWEMVFSPDDIWLTIAHGFAAHINANAEKLRHQFVNHEGQLYIEVQRDGFHKGSEHNDWPGVFGELSAIISEHIGKKRDLIVCNFTTTGPVERAASEVVLLDAMKSYFRYGVRTMSGFSKVTLLGEVSDWVNIRDRVWALAEFGMDWWLEHIIPTCDQFVAAAKGEADVEWWRRAVCQFGGSGRDDISGWLVTLFPYIGRGKKVRQNDRLEWQEARRGVDLCDFPLGVGTAPFTWHYMGSEIPMQFLGGLMSPVFDRDNRRVRTSAGWAIGEKKTT